MLIQDLIRQAAERYGVDPALALAVAERESAFNPRAVSSEGAQGVFQLMPATARELGVTDSFDPAQNVDAGVRYLRQTLDWAGGDTATALAMYNFGYGNVSKGRAWPMETKNYVSWILSKLSIHAPASSPPSPPAGHQARSRPGGPKASGSRAASKPPSKGDRHG
jgi:soluble lytic murein transglycosylase-like protein